jgi:hypothetical protein
VRTIWVDVGGDGYLVGRMGQLVGVVEKRSSTRGVVRFELNRSLSGMGHERFASVTDAVGHTTPSAILARLLFATGQVDSVHVYANIVTVDISKGHDAEGLAEIVAEMYRYWKPGVQPPSFEDLQPDEPAESSGGDAGSGADGDAELSEAAKRVPSHLLERSRAARERWKAKQG